MFSPLWNNILILGGTIYSGSLYYVYSKPSTKPFCSSSSESPYCELLVFICWGALHCIVIYPSLPHLKHPSLSSVVSSLLLCVQIYYSCNTWLCVLVCYSVIILFPLVCPFLHRLFLNLSCSHSRYWSTYILVQLLLLPPSIVLDSLGLELVDIPLWLW